MQKNLIPNLKSLNFSENYNNKFLCFSFIVIDDGSIPNLELSETVQITLRKSHFCFATLLKKETISPEEAILRGYNFLDRNLNEKEFLSLWNINKNLQVLYFKKVTQLELFDDNTKFELS